MVIVISILTYSLDKIKKIYNSNSLTYPPYFGKGFACIVFIIKYLNRINLKIQRRSIYEIFC